MNLREVWEESPALVLLPAFLGITTVGALYGCIPDDPIPRRVNLEIESVVVTTTLWEPTGIPMPIPEPGPPPVPQTDTRVQLSEIDEETLYEECYEATGEPDECAEEVEQGTWPVP